MEVEVLKARFKEVYSHGGEPKVCRSPGRVNLIGEHMDYNGLPVLPMPIDEEIRFAFSPRDDQRVVLRNVDPCFEECSFDVVADIPPSPQGSWDNYSKAAIQKLNHHFQVTDFPGMNVLVSSTLPMAVGLSSSSAFVVGSALMYLDLLGKQIEKDISRVELADLMATAEHYVGTRGGGMDQAAILNGQRDHACKIDFFPLRIERAPLPTDAAIVVCDSMVKVEKSGDALLRFNAGPRLCQLAAALVQVQLTEEFGEGIEIARIGDLWLGPLCLTYQEGAELVARAISKPRMGMDDIEARLGLSENEIRERYLLDLPEPEDGYAVQGRAKHPCTEFRRVEKARDALLAGDSARFGKLMNESHTSCADDFGVSSPELDSLVAAARRSGALGSRLTGAGFGGATVSLVPMDQIDEFVEGVQCEYYQAYQEYTGEPPIFVARAADGASLLD